VLLKGQSEVLARLGALAKSLLVGLLVIELHRYGPLLSRQLLYVAASLLPKRDREYFLGSWLSAVPGGEDRGVIALARALPVVLIAAPLLGVGLRIGRGKGA
jgi:hypothetical protein